MIDLPINKYGVQQLIIDSSLRLPLGVRNGTVFGCYKQMNSTDSISHLNGHTLTIGQLLMSWYD